MSTQRWLVAALLGVVSCLVPLAPFASSSAAEPAAERPANVAEPLADANGAKSGEAPVIFERVSVLGAPETIDKIPGSVTYIDKQQLAEHDYGDVHRILRRVPGVNIQEEEGYGLRPNIGMRGSGVERSAKITTLEDGVLIAPAPYSAPSAYYFPTVGRMEGVEVSKGASAIRNGPFTNGGVLNFISSGIPSSFGGNLNLAFGDNETLRGRFKIGDAKERFGWLFETYQFDTAGFKDLDGGGDTGVRLEDYLAKFRVNSSAGARFYQALEIKAGKTRQFGNETYVGLTQSDFELTPFRRYAGSQEDTLDTDHQQFQARYLVRPTDKLDFTATVYRNEFFRNWHKLDSVGRRGVGSVLDDPLTYAAELDVLRANTRVDRIDETLAVRNNRRDYYAQGVQAVVGLTPGGAHSTHEVEVGLRYHQDEEDRFQEDDSYLMNAAGRMVLTSLGDPGSQSNRVNSADALAIFVQDTISSGNWTLVPGVRFESIDFKRVDYDDAARSVIRNDSENGVDVVIPGVGVSYQLDPASLVFGGIHRGFAPPGPGTGDADPEESVNYEVGYRRNQGGFSLGTVGFFNDYDNLLGACTVSSGCSAAQIGDVFDGGKVRVFGLEAEVGYDLGKARKLGYGVPISLTYTATRAEFRTAFESDYEAWGNVSVGDRLPYLPEQQATLGLGLVKDAWSLFANVVYVSTMRTVAGQGPIPRDRSADAHVLLDLSANYRVHEHLRLFVQAQNLTDETYAAARRPAGVRPGMNRSVLAGVTLSF